MKRLRIVVEGYTEEEFVNTLLRPYLFQEGIYDISAIKISTSRGHKGGFVNYEHLKNDVRKLLNEPNLVVSTFVDFFRIPTNFPNYSSNDIVLLEQGMAEDINQPNVFLPYIQKHEFEALLFSSSIGFQENYDSQRITNAIQKIIDEYPNPEDINNQPTTAPSKRIEQIISTHHESYAKTIDGILIANHLGMNVILNKCPRFSQWVKKLTELCRG